MEGEKELQITPETKIGHLLDTYPHLEELLISIAPAFSTLRNPVMRRTVARVATIKQAASIGGISTAELVTKLRVEVGQSAFGSEGQEYHDGYLTERLPDWCSDDKVVNRIDISDRLAAGESPVAEVTKEAKKLKEKEVMQLTAPLVPVPLLDILAGQGYRGAVIKDGNLYRTYIGLVEDQA